LTATGALRHEWLKKGKKKEKKKASPLSKFQQKMRGYVSSRKEQNKLQQTQDLDDFDS